MAEDQLQGDLARVLGCILAHSVAGVAIGPLNVKTEGLPLVSSGRVLANLARADYMIGQQDLESKRGRNSWG